MKGFLFEEKNLVTTTHLGFLAVILVPFVIFGSEIEAWARQLAASQHTVEICAATIALLSLDVLLPVPSSFVNMTATLHLGPTLGFAVVFAGLSISCFIGYWFGYSFRKTLFDRFYHDPEFRNLTFDLQRYGFITLVTARGMPVMAELSVMAAGYHRYPLSQFLFATLLSNAILATIYAVFLYLAADIESLAFLAFTLIAVPGCAIFARVIWNLYRRRIT